MTAFSRYTSNHFYAQRTWTYLSKPFKKCRQPRELGSSWCCDRFDAFDHRPSCFLFGHADEATARPANSVEVFLAKDERGQVSTLASLDATVVLWPDEAREIRIEMPQEIASSAAPSVGWRCGAAPATDQSLLAVTWSTFQLCFVVSQVKLKQKYKTQSMKGKPEIIK